MATFKTTGGAGKTSKPKLTSRRLDCFDRPPVQLGTGQVVKSHPIPSRSLVFPDP